MTDRVLDRSFNGILPVAGVDRFANENPTCFTVTIYNRSAKDMYVRVDGLDPDITGSNDGDLVIVANGYKEISLTDAKMICLGGVPLSPYSIELS